MWKIQLPTGEYLESVPALQFELNNQVFSNSDASVLPGSFSFPVDLDLTPANRRLLDFPDLVTNSRNWKTYAGCWVYADGVPLFFGTLTIRQATARKVSITVVANPMSDLKEKMLNTLSMGGDRTWTGDLADHMKNTARIPEDWDYAFFPIFTADITDSTSDSRYQNKFDAITTHEFEAGSNAITPFVRLDYLLQQMFAELGSGYAFVNMFQTSDELRRLYVYNNMDARVSLNGAVPSLPTALNLNRHIPTIKCPEFLKKLIAQWCLGLFTNVFSRRIKMLPLRTVLNRPAAHDWTQYAIAQPTRDEASDVPNVFNYPDQESLQGSPEPQDLPLYNTVAEYAVAAAAGLPVGYYYVESETCIFHIISQIPGTTYQEQHYVHRGVYIAPEDKPFEGVMGAIFDGENYCRTQSGISRYREEDDGFGGTEYKLKTEECPVALMLYRGWEDDIPRSRNHVWDPSTDPATRTNIYTDNVAGDESEVSLMWFGEYGLYEKWHKQWNQMLLTGKHVTQSFTLPITELVKFSFEDKIRVVNMDYFVKRLRVQKLIGRGLALVEVSMVSVV